jgi:phosphoribosyl 1,2-cyclic phosphodiesterase
VRTGGDRLLVLDAGSAIRALGSASGDVDRVDVVLTHLHMDHIQGLPFFAPLHDPGVRVDIWGPVSDSQPLSERLNRYLSPPLFPVRVRDLPNVAFHDVSPGVFEVGDVRVTADLVSHPGPTLGLRLEGAGGVVAYLPDHEPALGAPEFPRSGEWTSGYALARDADVLIHDTQYTDEEYPSHVGWGHSACSHVLGFASLTKVRQLATFHHDPDHTDETLDQTHRWLQDRAGDFEVVPGRPGTTFDL